MKRLLALVLCSSLLLPTTVFAGKSPEGKVIETNQNVTDNGTVETNEAAQPIWEAPADLSGGLISPETGVLGASREHEGYVNDEATEIPMDAFDKEKDKVNWDSIYDYNPEIYAWIRIPLTNVDYPLLQHSASPEYLVKYEDQLFYKWHDFYGDEKEAGSIFTQYPSDLTFKDQINFVYGNNVIDGSMFQNLHKFIQDVEVDDLHLKKEDKKALLSRKINDDGIRELIDDDLIVYVYTYGKKFTYHIYSAYYWNNEHLQFKIENGQIVPRLQTKEDIKKYIEETKNPKTLKYLLYNEDKFDEITEDSRILTMSTSIKDNKENRLLVQAVLVNEEDIQEEYGEGKYFR